MLGIGEANVRQIKTDSRTAHRSGRSRAPRGRRSRRRLSAFLRGGQRRNHRHGGVRPDRRAGRFRAPREPVAARGCRLRRLRRAGAQRAASLRAHRAKPIPWRSIRTSGSTARWVAAACSTKIPRPRCAAFSHDADYIRRIGLSAGRSIRVLGLRTGAEPPVPRARSVDADQVRRRRARWRKPSNSNIACAKYLEKLVHASADFEMLAPVGLSIFCFRYRPRGFAGDLNALNERVLVGLQRDGGSYLSNADHPRPVRPARVRAELPDDGERYGEVARRCTASCSFA